jgi:peptide subunit release factor 1 (eRF1)
MLDIKNLSRGLKKILEFNETEKYVISLYLPVDSLKYMKQEYTTKLNSMIVKKRADLENDDNYTRSQKKNIVELLEKIKNYINKSFVQGSTKTLLLYAGEDELWVEVKLPVTLSGRIIIDPKPHTQVLRSLLNSIIRYGILIIDREKAQIYSMYLGEINEYIGAFISDVPPKVNFKRQAALMEKKILSRIEEKLHHFFRIIDENTLELLRKGKFDHLILAGKKNLLSQYKNYMHSFLQQRYIGDILAEPDDPPQVIRDKAEGLITEFEADFKNNLIDRLLDEYNPNRLGILGVEAVINSLMLEQVKTLIYDSNFQTEGYVCDECRFLTVTKREECPYCKGKLLHYSDITDEIIEIALDQKCEIFSVEGNQRLIDAGSIGAVLRFTL